MAPSVTPSTIQGGCRQSGGTNPVDYVHGRKGYAQSSRCRNHTMDTYDSDLHRTDKPRHDKQKAERDEGRDAAHSRHLASRWLQMLPLRGEEEISWTARW